MEKNKKSFHYAWIILIALSIIIGLGKGTVNNSAGLFLSPVAQDLGIDMGSLTLYFSISAIITMVFLPVAGKLITKHSPRLVIIASILLQSGSFALFGLMRAVWGWYALSIPLSIGGTMIVVVAGPVLINQWFKQKNGLALGILNAGTGVMGALSQPMIGKLIQSRGWSFSYIAVGLVVMAISIPVTLLLIRRSPEAMGVEPYGVDEETKENTDAGDTVAEASQGIDITIAKKSIAFYALFVYFLLIVSVASFAMHIPTFLTEKGFDIGFTGAVMGYYSIGVLVASLLVGFLIDKIGAKSSAILVSISGIIGITLMLISNNISIIIVAVSLFGAISSSIATVGPALTSTLFGNKSYGEIYSRGSLGLAVASIIALPAYGFLYDKAGNYTMGLYAIIGMLLIVIGAVFVAFKDKEKLVAKGHWN